VACMDAVRSPSPQVRGLFCVQVHTTSTSTETPCSRIEDDPLCEGEEDGIHKSGTRRESAARKWTERGESFDSHSLVAQLLTLKVFSRSLLDEAGTRSWLPRCLLPSGVGEPPNGFDWF